MAYASGYTMKAKYNWDGLAWTYTTIAAFWTIVLACGIVFLIINRNVSYIRIRNVPLSVSAVVTLHVYWCLCMTAYVLNGNFPCGAEFWIMSIYLPLGVALFQASNTQVLHISRLQHRLAYNAMPNIDEQTESVKFAGWRKVIAKWNTLTSTRKTTIVIVVGMAVQSVATLGIFMSSRMFHPSFGSVGQPTNKITCRKGWQWIPSIVWQFTWSWVYAPYLLWKIRRIDDVHCWRLQTMICCMASMIGSPLWLTALYVPAFHRSINFYCPPPLWFTPGIGIMEACLVFMPLWQILKNTRLKKDTLEIIAEWEEKQKWSPSIGSDSTQGLRHSSTSHKSNGTGGVISRRGEMYTMQALEKALQTNPTPLLLFAALKDFSGENIGFLKEVQEWKQNWECSNAKRGIWHRERREPLGIEPLRRDQFHLAVQIYSSFVSLRSSNYPVNLSSTHYKELEVLFDGATGLADPGTEGNAVTPFNSNWTSRQSLDPESSRNKDRIIAMSHHDAITDDSTPYVQHLKMNILRSEIPSWIRVPDDFGPQAFDKSQESIKYMVLTNTWPKFVSAGFAHQKEQESRWSSVKQTISRLVQVSGQQWSKLIERLQA